MVSAASLRSNRRTARGETPERIPPQLTAANSTALPATPGHWVPETFRQYVISTRPWSVSASAIPVILAGALAYRHAGADLWSVNYVVCLVCIPVIHLAGNLLNTYYDFKYGIDKPGSACDDRALVDKRMDSQSLLWFALCLLSLGVSAAAAVVYNSAHKRGLVIVVLAALLTVSYTGKPAQLKYRALGDLVIFVMFGPMLMLFVVLAVTTTLSTSALALTLAHSVPVGLQTVAVLHANNARDAVEDKAAGIRTVALVLGPTGSYMYYLLLVWGGYIGVAFLAVLESWRVAMPLVCAPWALCLAREYRAGKLQELPQRTAQHNLLFTTIVALGVCTPDFAVRALLGCLFYLGGINNILMWDYVKHLVREKVTNVCPMPSAVAPLMSDLSLAMAVGLQLPASVLFILGVHAHLMAKVLLLFLVPVTFLVHDFWTILTESPKVVPRSSEHDGSVSKRTVPIFPAEFDSEFVHFFKNVQIMGGLLVYIMYAPA